MGRVLMLTQVLPYPLDSGPKIRAYYVLMHLRQHHEVTLVSFVRQDDKAEHIAHLKGLVRQVHVIPMRRSVTLNLRAAVLGLFSGDPIVIRRDELPEAKALLRRLVEEEAFDVIHADQMSMALYGLYARDQARELGQNPRTVLDSHNALYRVYERLAVGERNLILRALWRRETRALRRYEWRTVSSYDRTVCVTEEDRQDLQPGVIAGQDGAFPVIPICNDLEDRHWIEPGANQPLVTHMGTMFWPPNIEGVAWFASQVWPLVAARAPSARLMLIGKRPPQEIIALGDDPRIEVLGYVDDPKDYLARTAAFLVPLHSGAGMRVKIIDAWCWGVPMVSTTVGSEGIMVRDGENILIADEPQAFAHAVLDLLNDEKLRSRLRHNGRQWVGANYDWRKVYPQWDVVHDI